MIGVAAIQSGRWDSLSWKEKKAMIASNSGAVVVKALQDSGQWNGLPFAVKQALVKSNSKAQVAQAVIDGNTWNTLPLKVKKMLANNADARTKLKQAGIDVDSYNSKGVPTKHMKGDSSSVKSHSNQGKSAVNSYNSVNPGTKNFKAKDMTSGPGNSALGIIHSWNAFTPITHVFTSIFNTITKNHHAKGTNHSPGGPSILGDGGRPEPFYMPKSGFFGISPATDTPYNLERGTKVWSSVGNFMRDLPHFKNGTANNTRALGTLLKASAINQDTNVVINNNSQAADLKNVEVKLDKMIMLLSGKLTVDVDSDNRLIVKNDNIRTTMQEIGWQTQINQRGRLNG